MKCIMRWIIALALILSGHVTYAQEDQRFFYVLSAHDYDTVFKQGLPVLPGEPNPFSLLVNRQCGLNGLGTLYTHEYDLLGTAMVLSRSQSRPVFIYEVRPTSDMRALGPTVSANRNRPSIELRSILDRLARLEERWITPSAIAREDIRRAYEVRNHRDEALDRDDIWTTDNHFNRGYIDRPSNISDGVFLMRGHDTVILNNLIRQAQLDPAQPPVDACSLGEFICRASEGTMLSASFSNGCLTEDDFIELPARTVLARKLLPILMVEDE